jgi:DNA-binding MarR family transcriptional regulator
MKSAPAPGARAAVNTSAIRRLAWFRYRLRQFLRFSEQAVRSAGATPQQYLLLLGIAGYTGRGWATVSELSEYSQQRHNAVVGLVQRAERRGLVRKEPGTRDRRFVRVRLTRRGANLLRRLASLHYDEVQNLSEQIEKILKAGPQAIKAAKGA